MNILDTSLEFLKGVGPQRAKLLEEGLKLKTFEDLLFHFPFRYVDRSKFTQIAEITSDLVAVQLKGKMLSMETAGTGRASRLVAKFSDGSGTLDLIWFQGARWIRTTLKPGVDYVVFGKPNFFKGQISIPHPEIDVLSAENNLVGGKSLQPVYHSSEKLISKGLNSKGIERLQKTLIQQVFGKLPEHLPYNICAKWNLMPLNKALKEVHFPAGEHELQKAVFRLKFDELFLPQLQIIRYKLKFQQEIKSNVFAIVGDHFNNFYAKNLPFELTNAQKRVIKEIRADMRTGNQMNRLLQGDVGSGKTIVALLSMLIAIDNGYQAALMAPTEILANQHYSGLCELLGDLPIEIAILTGSTKQKQRRIIHQKLEEGSLHILVGTHALIEPVVQFKNLGLCVIDEQHRFGVAQRAKLWKKAKLPPHILVMTATPIPRTLAMTVYGDLDVSVIDELPPGRKPIQTKHKSDAARLSVFQFMKDQIKLGRQIYVVYPLINESETLDYKDLMDGYESISRAFPLPEFNISIVHGKMKPADKDFEMARFVKGQTQILIATTVIEVGVNVPNASVMVIESAERFGLSQLHQLRGRVGRGASQSYCILMTGHKLSEEGLKRMKTMVSTNDGFKIAEVDLEMRGPGDLMGTQQSGMLVFKIANLAKDGAILSTARSEAVDLLKGDPDLIASENSQLRLAFKRYLQKNPNWGKIS